MASPAWLTCACSRTAGAAAQMSLTCLSLTSRLSLRTHLLLPGGGGEDVKAGGGRREGGKPLPRLGAAPAVAPPRGGSRLQPLFSLGAPRTPPPPAPRVPVPRLGRAPSNRTAAGRRLPGRLPAPGAGRRPWLVAASLWRLPPSARGLPTWTPVTGNSGPAPLRRGRVVSLVSLD